MARPLRIEYPGALYHIMSRGNASQDIFLDNSDYQLFLDNLQHCLKLHNLVCHAFCLMTNHYHLLLETPDGNLSKAMRNINGNYSQLFNAKHNRFGHVLQGRYKAYIIEKESYLLEVARYIVNNPVKAAVVKNPKDWLWSSYRATSGINNEVPWLETNFILGLFSENKTSAQNQYVDFVNQGATQKSPYNQLKEGVILGSEQFITWVWDNFSAGSETIKDIPRSQRVVGRPMLNEIFEKDMTILERNEAIKFARFRCGYLASQIARHLNLDPSVVARISRDKYNLK